MNYKKLKFTRSFLACKTVTGRPKCAVAFIINALFILLTTSCSNSINVDAKFPNPVVSKLPIEVTGVYSEALSSFNYKESEKNREKWKIKAGKAHTALFDTVFSHLFSHYQTLSGTWPPSADITKKTDSTNINNIKTTDLYIIPSVKDFQYSSPKETRLNVYEVWFKYNIKVFDKDQSLIADWIMSSYGKTPTALLKSKEKAMEQALVMSLRDLGASLSLGFERVPEVRDWLASKPAADLQARQESQE